MLQVQFMLFTKVSRVLTGTYKYLHTEFAK